MKRIFFMDIDGTLAISGRPLPGTLELLGLIKARGGYCRYFTNNSSKGTAEYQKQFDGWGVATTPEEFLTAGVYSVNKMKQLFGTQKLFLVATEGFAAQCRAAGLRVTCTPDADCAAVFTAFDTELTYRKAADACALLHDPQMPWYATNPDLCCPSSRGMIPDCGAICRLLQCAVGREPQFLGKPNPGMILDELQRLGLSAEDALVVGDRLYTDIDAGVNAGADTCLVLTGEETAPSKKATYNFASVAELAAELRAGRL